MNTNWINNVGYPNVPTDAATKAYVDKVQGTGVSIMDTRKTIPGLRLAQKYAVTAGGGYNQRMGLYDGVLIKENHIAACGGVAKAIKKAFDIVPNHIPIQIEVETFSQLKFALNNGAKLILLDNMTLEKIKKCVEYNNGNAKLEISGDINLDNVLDYAKTGVDRISIGSLTKHIQAINLSMRIN
jgi:nicotinate-nucleotide pyrophosphorylase (carboxylating)